MAYTPYYVNGWQSGEEGDTPITPAALNHMDDGITGAVSKSGDTMTGNLTLKNPAANMNTSVTIESTRSSGAVSLYTSDEGGNIRIIGPDGEHYFEMDAYDNDTLRIYSYDDSDNLKSLTFNRTTGVLSAPGGFSGTATNVTGTVALANGGLGVNASTSAGKTTARTNLGIQKGEYSVAQTAGGAYTDTTVTFGSAFASVPTVVVGLRNVSTTADFGNCSCAVVTDSITTTGCTVRFYNGSSVQRSAGICWIAIG